VKRTILHSADDTRRFGEHLACSLDPDDKVVLIGPMGAGKTTLVQGIAKGLGVAGAVTSPTFTIVNEYPFPNGLLRHVDLFRLNGPSDLLEIGFYDFWEEPGIVLVEWGDRLPEDLRHLATRSLELLLHPEGREVRKRCLAPTS